MPMLLYCEISIPVKITGFILELIFEKLSKIYQDKQSNKKAGTYDTKQFEPQLFIFIHMK